MQDPLETTPPTRRSHGLNSLPCCATQTAIMDDSVIWKDGDNTAPDPHATAELLMADHTVALVCDCDVPVPAALSFILVVSQVQASRNGYAFGCT